MNESQQFNFICVTTQEILEKVNRFRYNIMHEELGWIEANSTKKERDAYDDYSEQFAILNNDGEFIILLLVIQQKDF